MRADLYIGPKTTLRMRTMVNVNNIRRDIRNVCNIWWSWGFQLMDYCGIDFGVGNIRKVLYIKLFWWKYS